MMFQALYERKILNYPYPATFLIEQKDRRGNPTLSRAKPTFERAITKFHRTRRTGHTTTLFAIEDGKATKLISLNR